jgi:hypothetical protein
MMRVEEVHRAWMKEGRGEKGNGQWPTPFMAARWHGREERQGGPGSAPCGGREARKREGAPGVMGDSSSGRHRPPASGHGWRHCCTT